MKSCLVRGNDTRADRNICRSCILLHSVNKIGSKLLQRVIRYIKFLTVQIRYLELRRFMGETLKFPCRSFRIIRLFLRFLYGSLNSEQVTKVPGSINLASEERRSILHQRCYPVWINTINLLRITACFARDVKSGLAIRG